MKCPKCNSNDIIERGKTGTGAGAEYAKIDLDSAYFTCNTCSHEWRIKGNVN